MAEGAMGREVGRVPSESRADAGGIRPRRHIASGRGSMANNVDVVRGGHHAVKPAPADTVGGGFACAAC